MTNSDSDGGIKGSLSPADTAVDTAVVKKPRGFAAMDRARVREIASTGGRAAHLAGTAHQWSGSEAREAGRKGGQAARRPRSVSPPATEE